MKDAGEKAMALVDGQLTPAEVPSLVQELARNAVAGRGAADVSGHVAEPDRVRLRGQGRGARSSMADRYGHARRRCRAASRYRIPGSAAALSAGCRGAIAFPRGRWRRRRRRWPCLSRLQAVGRCSTRAAAALIEVDLGAALERTASGKDAALATVRPVLSFNSKTAGWCRQFEVRHATRQVSHALACRGEDGQWSVVASTPPGPAGFVPAGTDRRKAIDDLATSMMQGSPLSPEEEAALIGRRWRSQ